MCLERFKGFRPVKQNPFYSYTYMGMHLIFDRLRLIYLICGSLIENVNIISSRSDRGRKLFVSFGQKVLHKFERLL